MVWLLPVIFMMHDFEEIFLIEAWKNRFAEQLKAAKNPPFAEMHDTASFSIGIALEFVFLSVVTLFACIFDSYYLWYGLFFGFAFHLLLHCFLTIKFKHYVPGVVSAIPFLALSIMILWKSYELCRFAIGTLAICCVGGVAFVLAMILVLHKLMPTFEKWVARYRA
jgi:hypothetical protein